MTGWSFSVWGSGYWLLARAGERSHRPGSNKQHELHVPLQGGFKRFESQNISVISTKSFMRLGISSYHNLNGFDRLPFLITRQRYAV